MSRYEEFVERKLANSVPTGLTEVPELSSSLFPFQKDIVRWALRRGRAAIFADTGLGKTRMQLEWARHVPSTRVLIVAPLAVAAQTSREGGTMGVDVKIVRSDDDVGESGIFVTNYDRLHRFDLSKFDAVVLDESSCIKHHDAKTFRFLCEAFAGTKWKLCATATPAPNDFMELGTHAEFLGIRSRSEMLAEYFVHDGGETSVWRLKGHARKDFWRWVSSWGALVQKPSDLGYENDRYDLPPLNVYQHIIPADQDTVKAQGLLFAEPAKTLTERRAARKASIGHRVRMCADIVNSDRQPWVVWCDLNAESEALVAEIPDAIEIRGSMDIDEKERLLNLFSTGEARVIISKPSITGFGLNWQHCARMAFVGVTDSYESYYQAIRRIWRFGQTRPCDVHIFASEIEGSVVKNLERKAQDAARMAEELSRETRNSLRENILGSIRETNPYNSARIEIPSWLKSEAVE